jgi:hypothetical protein
MRAIAGALLAFVGLTGHSFAWGYEGHGSSLRSRSSTLSQPRRGRCANCLRSRTPRRLPRSRPGLMTYATCAARRRAGTMSTSRSIRRHVVDGLIARARNSGRSFARGPRPQPVTPYRRRCWPRLRQLWTFPALGQGLGCAAAARGMQVSSDAFLSSATKQPQGAPKSPQKGKRKNVRKWLCRRAF